MDRRGMDQVDSAVLRRAIKEKWLEIVAKYITK